MGLYRAKAGDGVAWVTGASTGIGRRLALDLARDGYTVAATARGADRLAELSGEAAALRGRIIPFPCDVTDAEGMATTARNIEAEAGPIVLAVFNAGNYFPVGGDRLELKKFRDTVEINFLGAVNGIVPVVARMRAQGRGQIALVGSVTAYNGLPTSAAYGATKAALNNMAAALKFDFDKMNIRIQVINPGFVDTPLTEKNDFAMPFLVPVEKASAIIMEGLRSGGFEITFPRRLSWALKVADKLPWSLYFPLMARLMGWDKRPVRD